MRDQSQTPNFPGIRPPSIQFDEVRDGRRAEILWLDIDLTNARAAGSPIYDGANQNTYIIAGNSFYVDNDATNIGNARVHFQDVNVGTASAPLTVGAGFIANVPFTQIKVENTAQAGKRLRIFYGVDLDFTPGLNSQFTLTQAVPVRFATSSCGAVTVNATDTTIANANTNRNFLLIQNNDPTNAIYVKFGGAASVGGGILIAPNGGNVVFDQCVPTDAVHAINASGSNANVILMEG